MSDLLNKYSGSSEKEKRKVLKEIQEKNSDIDIERIGKIKNWIKRKYI